MYCYFLCLPASSALSHNLPDLFRTSSGPLPDLFRTSSRPLPDLPDLSQPSHTPSDPFPVFHPLPDNFHGFHWLPPAPGSLPLPSMSSAHFRSELRNNSPCLGVMIRNSRGPFRPKRHLIVPLCLGTLFLVIIVFIVLSLSHCSSLLLLVYYYI